MQNSSDLKRIIPNAGGSVNKLHIIRQKKRLPQLLRQSQRMEMIL